MKFSFDFPEPSVEFAGLRFGFLVFTRENTYALDASTMTADATGDAVAIKATGLTWAGGQVKAAGGVDARLQQDGDVVLCDVTAHMEQPIKAVTVVVRGIPRGKLSSGGGAPFDPKDDEVLWGYPFGAGDLFGDNTAWGMGTPLTVVQTGGGEQYTALSSLDDTVRAKRFYFQPGEQGYRVELVHEVEGWLDRRTVQVPTWCVRRAASLDAAVAPHYAHLERAYHFPKWETRTDVPDWLRRTELVVTLHGMHFTGYIFNDYTRMLDILRWIATQLPADRVLAFISAWDGRYYWDYPTYQAAPRMGGEAGFKRLVTEAQRLGFKIMPMFGANAANRKLPNFSNFADGATARIDGDPFDLNWVDWDNDRHQEGFGVYMNLGVPEKIRDYANIPFDGIGLMRIEFIIASYIGEHPLYLIETGREKMFVDRLAQGIATVAREIDPRPVVVRFSDFKSNEYKELKGGEKYEETESNPMIGWRGVSRYIAPEYLQAFKMEVRAIKKVREEMGLTNVWVMLPFVRTLWEVERCVGVIEDEGLKRGDTFKVWLMAEVLSMVFLADEFSRLCDGLSIGSNDLTQLTLGIDRDSGRLGRLGYFDERDEAVKRAIKLLIDGAHGAGRTISICGQAPSVYPELAEYLVSLGIDSISVNPDTVVKTKKLVNQVESRLVRTAVQRL